jgi:hypothetical protein
MNLFPASGGQATGLCRTQCQLPPRRHWKKEVGKGLENKIKKDLGLR